jgi:hypothetical protein
MCKCLRLLYIEYQSKPEPNKEIKNKEKRRG